MRYSSLKGHILHSVTMRLLSSSRWKLLQSIKHHRKGHLGLLSLSRNILIIYWIKHIISHPLISKIHKKVKTVLGDFGGKDTTDPPFFGLLIVDTYTSPLPCSQCTPQK